MWQLIVRRTEGQHDDRCATVPGQQVAHGNLCPPAQDEAYEEAVQVVLVEGLLDGSHRHAVARRDAQPADYQLSLT
jgi:hypothetical protein